MPTLPTTSSNIQGAASLVLAMLIFSLQDIAVKWIGGDYSILEIVMFRSVVALPFTLLFFRYEGGPGTTDHTTAHARIHTRFFPFSLLHHSLYGIGSVTLGRNRRYKVFRAVDDHLLVSCDAGRKGWTTSLAGVAGWFYGSFANCQTWFGRL